MECLLRELKKSEKLGLKVVMVNRGSCLEVFSVGIGVVSEQSSILEESVEGGGAKSEIVES